MEVEEFKKLSYIEQLKVLSREAFDAEDYATLREIRLKIVEWQREHSSSQKKKDSLEDLLRKKE